MEWEPRLPGEKTHISSSFRSSNRRRDLIEANGCPKSCSLQLFPRQITPGLSILKGRCWDYIVGEWRDVIYEGEALGENLSIHVCIGVVGTAQWSLAS
mmetsp:Transcript_753/g.1111  ORF Transcript_753/g.1111 Transcript_753/m.1111 type:complete len:98 (-) Transcript_753:46-339(-)